MKVLEGQMPGLSTLSADLITCA